MKQINLFEFSKPKYKIKNKVRLIETFAGIGSQAKALERLGVDFEHYKVIEFDKYAIASYNAVHNTNFETKDICQTTAKDLEIIDNDKYTYIFTWSFPCTDVSLAGKQMGMSRDSNTRSSLLWEVERILNECAELHKEDSRYGLPNVLLMENVPQVISKRNIKDFQEIQRNLEKLGYSNYVQLLNAKDYGIPQNRNRCFMVSILGDYFYQFPEKQELKLKLKDLLEEDVDEKYYLSDKFIDYLIKHTEEQKEKGNGFSFNPINVNETDKISKTINTNPVRTDNTFISDNILIKNATKQGYLEANVGDGIDISARMDKHRGTVQKGMTQTLKCSIDVGVVVNEKISH